MTYTTYLLKGVAGVQGVWLWESGNLGQMVLIRWAWQLSVDSNPS